MPGNAVADEQARREAVEDQPSREAPLAIVTVNYGSHDLLAANLAGLELRADAYRVIVVDNPTGLASDRRAIRSLCEERKWTLIELERNVGFGIGMNAGARAAREGGCDGLLLLNPDVAIDESVLADLRERTTSDRQAFVTPRLLRPDGRVWFCGGRVDLDAGGLRPVTGAPTERRLAWLTGACLAVSGELWDRLGGFDEGYFLYWEDVEISVRAAILGARPTVLEGLDVVHDVGGTQHRPSSRAKSAAYYRYNCRNRLLFAAAHLGRFDQLRWLLRTPVDVRRVLMRGGRRQFLHPTRCIAPALAGVFAALPSLVRAIVTGRAAAASVPRPRGDSTASIEIGRL